MRRALAPAALAVAAPWLALVLGGCATSPARASAARLVVATTVAPITDIVRHVVGRRADVVGLVPEGVDSHTFEPSPGTVRELARADVLFLDGLHLDDSTRKQATANMRRRAPIVALGDRTLAPHDYAYDVTFPEAKGDPNPHVWMDPTLARRWSEIVRDTMSTVDPAGGPTYRANQSRYATALDQLDRAIAASIASIPENHRKLLTYHDSFAYFARRYRMTVIGAVQPSDFSEPTPRDVEALVTQVRTAGVPAVFGSEVFPSTVLKQVADQSGARYVDRLRDDQLPGPVGSPQHSYIGLMVDDVAVMTGALGGDPTPLRSVPMPTWSS